MKKLMIAAAIVCAAAFTQAASIEWKNGYGVNAYGEPGIEGTENPFVGNLYLMQGDATAAQSFLTAVLTAENFASEFNTQVATAMGSFAHTGFDPAVQSITHSLASGDYSFFVVGLDEANMGVYMSELATAPIAGVGASDVVFDHTGSYDIAAGANPFPAGTTTYASTTGGWYTAVPEPTSGLLLLLGVAGLALRRRRA